MSRDCVVVPGLGAFVSRHIPATVSDDYTSITPPSREIGFNASLSHDDGTLIGSITRREGVSYECARAAVEREVELIHRRLHNEGTLELPRIGSLSLASHGAIEFTPGKENSVATLPYSGLFSLTVSPVRTSAPAEAPTILHVDTTMEEEPETAPRRPWIMPALKYAASAAVFVGACLTLLTPISPARFDLASLQPSINKTEQTAQEITFPEPDAAKYADKSIVLFQPDPLEATATVTPKKHRVSETFATKAQTEKEAMMEAIRNAPRYYVIVASTSSMREARKYVKMHSTPTQPLQILPSDGRYRVFAASGNDFQTMSAYRTANKKFAEKNPNAWVYTLKK